MGAHDIAMMSASDVARYSELLGEGLFRHSKIHFGLHKVFDMKVPFPA
jgi:hypothetical protein